MFVSFLLSPTMKLCWISTTVHVPKFRNQYKNECVPHEQLKIIKMNKFTIWKTQQPKSTQSIHSFRLCSYFVFSSSLVDLFRASLCIQSKAYNCCAQTFSEKYTRYIYISLILSKAFSMYFKTIHFGYFIAVLPVVIVCDLCRILRMRYIHKSPKGNGNWIQSEIING